MATGHSHRVEQRISTNLNNYTSAISQLVMLQVSRVDGTFVFSVRAMLDMSTGRSFAGRFLCTSEVSSFDFVAISCVFYFFIFNDLLACELHCILYFVAFIQQGGSQELVLSFHLLLCCLEYIVRLTPSFELRSPFGILTFVHISFFLCVPDI